MNENNMTVAELFKAWIEEKRKTITKSTEDLYTFYYSKYLECKFGQRKVNEIMSEEWSAFESALPNEKGASGRRISKVSLRHAVQIYHSLFNFGKTEFGLNDPTGTIVLVPTGKDTLTVFSHDEVNKMLIAFKPFDIHHIGIMICLHTGITLGEICGTRWGDVDIENKMLSIRRVLVRENAVKDGRKTVVLKTNDLKGRAVRDIPIPTWIADQLEALKSVHRDDEYVLVGPLGGIDPTNFRYHYKEFLKQAGVSNRKINAMRHTFAVTCIEKGVDLKTLSELLGHSNMQITIKMYLNTDLESVREKLDRLYD